jgi:hypothetical protein
MVISLDNNFSSLIFKVSVIFSKFSFNVLISVSYSFIILFNLFSVFSCVFIWIKRRSLSFSNVFVLSSSFFKSIFKLSMVSFSKFIFLFNSVFLSFEFLCSVNNLDYCISIFSLDFSSLSNFSSNVCTCWIFEFF